MEAPRDLIEMPVVSFKLCDEGPDAADSLACERNRRWRRRASGPDRGRNRKAGWREATQQDERMHEGRPAAGGDYPSLMNITRRKIKIPALRASIGTGERSLAAPQSQLSDEDGKAKFQPEGEQTPPVSRPETHVRRSAARCQTGPEAVPWCRVQRDHGSARGRGCVGASGSCSGRQNKGEKQEDRVCVGHEVICDNGCCASI